MKKLTFIASVLFSALIFWSCDKETDILGKFEPTSANSALLKINYASAYSLNPAVQLKLNDVRVSNLLTGRTPFPGGGFNTGGGSSNDYLAINPGSTSVNVSIPNRNTSTDSVILFTGNLALEAGKNYSAHITDTGVNTKMVLLEDDITRPDTGRSKYRFVNLMPNTPSIDLYYGTMKVASNISYLSSSPYFEITRPVTSQTWAIREAGASATSLALATYLSGNTTLDQRVYTVFASGYKPSVPITATSLAALGTRRPFVAFYLNN